MIPAACAFLLAAAAAGAPAAGPVEIAVGETRVASLAFSPDGKRLAVGTFGFGTKSGVKLVDVAARKVVLEIPCPGRGGGLAVAFSPDGKSLAVADFDFAVTIRSVADGAEVASLPGDTGDKKVRQAKRVAFSPDGGRLAVGYTTGEMLVWDVAGKKVVAKADHGNSIDALAFSPDGRLVATGTGFGLRLWDAADGKAVVSLDEKSSGRHEVTGVAFLPDGKTVVTVDGPGFVRFFATADGKETGRHRMPGGETKISALAVSPDGKTVLAQGRAPITGGVTDGIVLIDAATAKPRALVKDTEPVAFALSPDGKSIAASFPGNGDPVILYDVGDAVPAKP
jgi:WD40 repeat protein